MYYVYEILNLVNGKRYIGKSKTPHIRWKSHISTALGKSKFKYPIHLAILAYGIENFKFSILYGYETEIESLDQEMILITMYKTNIFKYGKDYGYNLTDGGEGMSGFKFTNISKKKMSESAKRKIVSDEAKANMTIAARERAKCSIISNKIRLALTGIKRSEETKLKCSMARQGENSATNKLSSKQVLEIKKMIWIDGRHTSVIAKQFDVAPRTIRDIKNRLCWKSVNIEEEGQVELLHNNPNYKLNEIQVREIKLMIANGGRNCVIAKLYNVNGCTISDIRRGLTWKKVCI